MKKPRKPRDPESTLKGRLALMTEDRDYQMKEKQKYYELYNNVNIAIKAKEDRFVSYKAKADRALEWYRQVIQSLLSKMPSARQ